MKSYKTSKELIKDLEVNLDSKNPFDKYTLDRLKNPSILIDDYKKYPDMSLSSKSGWFYVWKNNVVEIDGEWVRFDDLFNKLEDLINKNI